uniref:Uncharacterized protein n=1 Tax=Nostoc flagelliforme str. Sunitezuoqi TaxID=676037 RepID=E7DPY6_9NOSO|nr:hypothetical protein Nfla_5603 [Nostoc flagelliforme str. Sunitezuoqi]
MKLLLISFLKKIVKIAIFGKRIKQASYLRDG